MLGEHQPQRLSNSTKDDRLSMRHEHMWRVFADRQNNDSPHNQTNVSQHESGAFEDICKSTWWQRR